MHTTVAQRLISASDPRITYTYSLVSAHLTPGATDHPRTSCLQAISEYKRHYQHSPKSAETVWAPCWHTVCYRVFSLATVSDSEPCVCFPAVLWPLAGPVCFFWPCWRALCHSVLLPMSPWAGTDYRVPSTLGPAVWLKPSRETTFTFCPFVSTTTVL